MLQFASSRSSWRPSGASPCHDAGVLLLETAALRLLTLPRIPLVAYCAPQVMQFDEDACVVRVPLGFRTRNHLGTMYVAALTCGADVAGGLHVAKAVYFGRKKLSFLFKTLVAEFLKRADGDVDFACVQGRQIAEAIAKAEHTGQRVEVPLQIVATLAKDGAAPIARFQALLSLKRRDR
jgi:acyl-coenzyme A thioesterase PaaI-like protein